MPRRSTATLLVLALLGAVGVVSPASATDYAITAAPNATTVLVKRYVTVSGTVLPPTGSLVTSRRAVIQQYRSGRWRTLRKARVRADGTFAGKVRFKTRGTKTLRVYRKRSSQSAAVASSTFKVDVVRRGTPIPAPTTGTPSTPAVPPPSKAPTLPPPPSEAWRPLVDDDIVERANGGFEDVAAQYTNGGSTPRTLQARVPSAAPAGQSTYADWALNRKCSLLTARVGLDDDTNPQSSQRVEVLLDGVVAFTQDMSIDQSVSLSLPVANALRVRLQTTKLSALDEDQHVNFGDAQVLCTPL